MMSPFEKKIATYQKSAEKRKQTGERSGSRTRLVPVPTGGNIYLQNQHHTIGVMSNQSQHSSN